MLTLHMDCKGFNLGLCDVITVYNNSVVNLYDVIIGLHDNESSTYTCTHTRLNRWAPPAPGTV